MSFIGKNVAYAIFAFIVVAIWSLSTANWGSDFGSYYAYSYFINDDYQLYKEAFSHKGPLYYLFISLLGGVIGWGAWQAYLTLLVTALIFYLPIIYILSKRVKSNLISILILIISLFLLNDQSTNLSISLFQGGFLLLSFYFLVESISTIENSKIKEYVISVTLFVCAVLVRIDVLIYAPVYLVAIVFSAKNLHNYFIVIKRIAVGLLISLALYMMNQMYFDYSLFEYFQHNIEFNQYYNSNPKISYIYRPEHFAILMGNGLIVLFSLVFAYKHTAILESTQKRKSHWLVGYKTQRYILTISILLVGIILWILSKSDKDYHVFLIAIPTLFFVVYWGRNLSSCNLPNKVLYIAIPVLLYMILLMASTGLKSAYKKYNCLTNIYCSESPLILYKKTIENISKKNTATIVGGRGWLYLFADTKPEGAINDWWIYYKKNSFVTKYLLMAHNRLITQPSEYQFWIDNSLFNEGVRSKYFHELIDNSELVENEGEYSRYKIIQKI